MESSTNQQHLHDSCKSYRIFLSLSLSLCVIQINTYVQWALFPLNFARSRPRTSCRTTAQRKCHVAQKQTQAIELHWVRLISLHYIIDQRFSPRWSNQHYIRHPSMHQTRTSLTLQDWVFDFVAGRARAQWGRFKLVGVARERRFNHRRVNAFFRSDRKAAVSELSTLA